MREIVLARNVLHERVDVATNLVGRDAFLLQCVTVANRDCAVLHRLAIDRDAERRSDLVLPTVTAADRPRFVVEYWKGTSQLFRQLFGELWHTIFLDQGKDSSLYRRQRRRETEYRSAFLLARYLLLTISIYQKRQRGSICTHRRLDHKWYIAPVVRLVEVLELLSRVLLVLNEVEITAVVYAFDLLETKRAAKVELNVEGGPRVGRELFLGVLVKLE